MPGGALTVPAFQSYAREFAAVLGSEPRLLRVIDVDAHEGPVYVSSEDALYFTSLGGQIKRLALDGLRRPLGLERVSVVPAGVVRPNGMCLGQDGRLLVCEQGSLSAPARVSAVDPGTGAVDTVVAAWGGLPLNSPNDVVMHSDGSVWFTDPSYGFLQGFRPKPQVGDFVYRYDPVAGRLTVVADSFVKPNGLAFSPDERTLYVTDSGANQEPGSFHPHWPHHVIAYDVVDGRHLSAGRLFAVITPGFPDGIKTDGDGRVYISSSNGVQVFDPSGDQMGEIRLPGTVNFTFGGADLDVLFIITDHAVWAAVLKAAGRAASPALTSKGA
jgi:gluconolactonase